VDRFAESAGLLSQPAFCAREVFLQAFWAMLGDGQKTGWEVQPGQRPSVLAIGHLRGQGAVGKTRLLHELARQALLNGDLPLLLGTSPDNPAPVNLRELADKLADEMQELGSQVLHLDGEFGIELKALGIADPTEPGPPPGDEVASLADALELDADTLCQAARDKYHDVFGDGSRVVVLVDNMREMSAQLLTKLFDRKHGLKSYGLGSSPDHPVPVVLVIEFEMGDDKEIRYVLPNGGRSDDWLVGRVMEPFRDNGEDMLAYELVLLHPFRSGGDELTMKPWIFNRAPGTWEHSSDYARALLGGKPDVFDQPIYDKFVRASVAVEILVPADDDVRPGAVR
jgi:hypothetical protein